MNNEEILKAIKSRHSVREYLDRNIDLNDLAILNPEIEKINKENNLHFQLVTNSPETFSKFILPYGKLKAYHYLALVGKKCDDLDEKVGYYGEKIVLLANNCSLDSCWVGGTYSKKNTKVKIEQDEKLLGIIALGYGVNHGHPHKSKTISDVTTSLDNVPDWFVNGVEAALLAPTAINQQKFKFTYNIDGSVTATAGKGPYSKVDLGIVKYHFEVGANQKIEWR
jgi:hypothetical protein